MKHSVSLTRITETPSCVFSSTALEIPTHIDELANDIWREEVERQGSHLFDGEIVSVVSIDGNRIVGRRADCRWLLAQSKNNSIFKWSQVRPLAVTGMLFCQEGVIIGHRSKSVYQFPGMGELAPSGSVDLSTLSSDSQISLKQQLMQELREEIGIDIDSVIEVKPLAVVSDTASQVFDVCFTVRTSLSWSDIQNIFQQSGSAEYDRLELLPIIDIPRFLQISQSNITPLTLALLQMVANEQAMEVATAVLPMKMHRAPRTAIIIQARKGSSRLPGKVLEKLGNKTLLEHVIARMQMVHNADMVVVATTTKETDSEIVKVAEKSGAIAFRGDEHDVLNRYLGAARAVDADIVLRVTSDCPLIDPALCALVILTRALNNADYVANNMPRLFPHGLDCEAFTRQALEKAARDATEAFDREHVTPWLRRHPDLRRHNVIGPGWPANQQRWTLDYPEDLLFFKRLFNEIPTNQVPDWQEALSLINQIPALDAVNAMRRVRPATANDPSPPTIVFRSVANQRIGTGHAMRCHALHTRLESLGWRCYWSATRETFNFLGSNISPFAQIELQEDDPIVHAETIKAIVGHCHVLIIDDYAVEKEFATAMRSFCDKIVYFDDLANRKLDADLVVNPTPGNWKEQYSTLTTRPVYLLQGPDFALLRQQFLFRRNNRAIIRQNHDVVSSLKRIFISFGGIDAANGTGLALDMLSSETDIGIDVVLGRQALHLDYVREQISQIGPRARLWTDVADMAALMVEADIAIGAPGTSTWERACLGLPSLLVGIAENQRENAKIVESCGAGIVAGFLTTEPREAVANRLTQYFRTLKGSFIKRKNMALAAAKLCDGRGGQRVAVALLPGTELRNGCKLHLRIVEAKDETLLMDWQREPETRRYALNPAIPSAEEHHNWLMERLASSVDWFLIAEIDGEPAGYVRLDWIGEDNGRPEYLISIATARSHHKKGIAAALLKAIRHLAPGAHFYAKILADNLASLSLFTGANYSLAADGYFHSYPAQRQEA